MLLFDKELTKSKAFADGRHASYAKRLVQKRTRKHCGIRRKCWLPTMLSKLNFLCIAQPFTTQS